MPMLVTFLHFLFNFFQAPRLKGGVAQLQSSSSPCAIFFAENTLTHLTKVCFTNL